MSTHRLLVGLQLHEPYHYVQESDPGSVGSNLYWLQVSTGNVKRRNSVNSAWDSISSGFASPQTTKGDLIGRTTTTPTRIPVGANGTVLTANSTLTLGVGWAAVYADPLTTKGDLLGRSATATIRIPVGADGLVLKTDSTDPLGVVWASATFPINFIGLSDAPASYTGQGLKAVRVKAAENGVEFYTPSVGATVFIGLTDVPASYTSQALKTVRVNAAANALEFYTPTFGATVFTGLTDVPSSYSGQALKAVRVNSGATALEFFTIAGGITTFTGLSDVPSSYSGQGLKGVRVNTGTTALEFYTLNTIAPAFTALTDGATITIICDITKTVQNAKVTLGGNRTLAISGAVDGMTGVLIVTQDGTGTRTLALPATSKVTGGGAGAITLTTTAGAKDILAWSYDGSNYFWTKGLNFT